MKLLVVIGLAALAAAKIPSRQWEEDVFGGLDGQLEQTAFKRGSEYQFRYNGQVATGLPGASKQHAATRIQALVSLVLKGENKALLKIHHIRMGRLNQRLYNPRAMVPFMGFQEVEIQEQQKEKLQLPVMFSYEQGVVSDLVLDGEEQPWSANIKKGIINLLQVNLAKQGQIKQAQEAALLNRMPEAQPQDGAAFDFYATQEKTVEGECETLYTITSDPNNAQAGPVLNVTRSVDFENCKQRPEIKYNFRFQDPCESCEPKYNEDGKFLKSSSVAKFNISGNQEEFLIQSAIVESQYQVVPFNRQGNVISTYVNQTLELVRAGPIVSKDLRQPQNQRQSDSDLMYTMEWDQQMEEFLMKGHNQATLPVELKEQVEMVRGILEDIVNEKRGDCVSEEAPVLYARLVKLLRLAEKPQLQQIYAALGEKSHSGFNQQQFAQGRGLLQDALADAGSKDSVSFLLHLIKNGKISPLAAALSVKQLVNIRTPSKEIIREFHQFLNQDVVKENFVLKQAAYLTLGSLVQGLCMPSEERLAILPRPSNDKTPRRIGPNNHLCPQQLQDDILEELFGMIEAGQQDEEKMEEAMLALKTIGNMGLPKSVGKLEQIIRQENSQPRQTIRIEAIIALRQLREVLPMKIQQILMPIFMAKYESNEVRMAAAYQILQTQPSRPVLDQIARKLFTERSHQVASFVFTYMTTLANSSNPCEAKFARDLQMSLRHGRKIQGAYLPHYSKVLHGSMHSANYRVGVDGEFVSVISNRTFVPRYIALDLHANAAGFWSKYIASVSIAQEGVESLIGRFARRTDFSDVSLDDILSSSSRAQNSPVKELKKIWQKLQTIPRTFSQMPQAFATLKLKDQEFFMAPITQKSIRSLPSMGEIAEKLNYGIHFNLHKAAQLHELQYKIPTTLGMPVIVKVTIPTVAQVSGMARLESVHPFKMEINMIKPSVAASILTSVTVWNPISTSGLAIKATAKICTPVKSARAELSLKGRQPELRLSAKPEEREIELVRFETRPMTFTRVYRFPLTAYPKAQYKTIPGEQWNRARNVRDIPGLRQAEQTIEAVSGQKVRVEGLWHRTPMNGPAYIPVCPFSGSNHFSVSTKGGEDMPKEWVFQMSASKMSKASGNLQSQQWEMEGEEEEFLSENYQSQGYQTTVKSELFTKGASKDRKAQMETTVKFSPNMRIVKAESEIKVSPIPSISNKPSKACFNGFVQYPKEAQSFQDLNGKAVVGQAEATWGQGQCKQQNKIAIKIGAKHSQQQKNQWESEPRFAFYNQQDEEERRQNPELYSPVGLEGVLNQPQQLLAYTAKLTYSNVPAIAKNATAAAFRALKTYYYWNTNQIQFGHNNPSGVIRAQLTVDTNTRQFFNLTVKTPVENVTFTDAQLPVPVMAPVSIRRLASQIQSPADILENVYAPAQAQCSVNSRRIRTFDGVQLRAPISNCWTVISKDCDSASNPAYAVLMKKTNGQQKSLKVVTRKHTIIAVPQEAAYDSLKVKVNGKQVQEAAFPDNQQARVQWVGQALEIVLPEAGVRVRFDGYSAQVEVSPLMGGAQCGICGHFNGERQGEFQTPEGETTEDARQFLRSYTLKEGKCAFPEDLEEMDSDERLQYQPQWEQEDRYQDSQDEDEQDNQEEADFNWQPRRSIRPVQRFVAEEEAGKLCVSAQTVARCPADSFPSHYEEQETEVAFKCISRRHPQAHRILAALQHQSSLPQEAQEALDEQSQQYVNQIPQPTQCSRDF